MQESHGGWFYVKEADIGYDLYCTSWEMLENDAQCCHAHLSRLFDSMIVYCKDKSCAGAANEFKLPSAEDLRGAYEEMYSNWKITLWVSVVYVLSFICYVPTLLEQNGMIIPNILLYVKYLYVCIPSIAAVFLLICEQNVKVYFSQMFSGKITARHILVWAVCMAAGILCSYCYSLITGVNVNIYLSSASLLANCIYLLITALVEEIAWRGFLLERSPFKKKIISVIFVGAVWAVWHMPMWIIRNSLSFGQIVWLCIWTVIVSVGLGMTYYQCRNILLTTMIHAAFNICYLAPMQYNVVILAIVISAGTLLYKKSAKKFLD